MKATPVIDGILIISGLRDATAATEFFKTHFFARNDSLDAILAIPDLNKTWVREQADIDELGFMVEKRIQAYKEKDYNLSGRLRDEEWDFIEKHSKTSDDFKLYNNRSSKIFGKTRVYVAFKGRDSR